MNASVEIWDSEGARKVRYEIVEGAWVGGRFVRDDDGEEVDGGGVDDGDVRAEMTVRTKAPETETEPERKLEQEQAILPTLPTHPEAAPAADEETPSDEEALWCTCRRRNDGSLMIACENEECAVVWFHGRCVGVEKAPEGEWWCEGCRPAAGGGGTGKGKGPGGKGGRRKSGGKGGGKGKGKGKGGKK